jgi:hypothetical protein
LRSFLLVGTAFRPTDHLIAGKAKRREENLPPYRLPC